MKKIMLLVSTICLFTLSAYARAESISEARQKELLNAVITSESVAAIEKLVTRKVGAKMQDAFFGYVLEVDCSKNPSDVYFDDLTAEMYCAMTTAIHFGGLSNPYLVILTNSYIRKSKIQSGVLKVQKHKRDTGQVTDRNLVDDIAIVSMELKFPLYTGLE